MLRRSVILALLLVATALLGAPIPAGAHPSAPLHLDATPADRAGAADAEIAGATGRVLTAAPEVPGPPWLGMLGALIVLAAGSRRPRHAFALALVLILTVFAFEDGVHSVHHGIGPGQGAACSLATASAHLSATAAEEPAVVDVIAPSSVAARDPDQSDPPPRCLCAAPGRAPPSANS